MNQYKTPLAMLIAFLQDEEAWDMFISGPAGTGKTTSLCELVDWCTEIMQDENDNDVPRYNIIVCAHTHKACGVLRAVFAKAGLPNIVVCTLHSYLNKRPTVNQDANHVQHLESSMQVQAAEKVDIVFVDEFSMVGEKDLMDLRALQDPEYEGDPVTRLVWIGDPYQLPPVKDQQSVVPHDPYWYKLSEVKRTDGPLLEVMAKLVEMLEGGEPQPLLPNAAFHRNQNLQLSYEGLRWNNEASTIAILAYTNEAVERWNETIAGKQQPELGDILFCSTLHTEFELLDKVEPFMITSVDRFRDEPLTLGSKYKTLEFLLQEDMCEFFRVVDADFNEYLFPVVFGTYQYKKIKEQLAIDATRANKEIERTTKAKNATEWSRLNPLDKLARKRAKAWRRYLTFKDCVQCMDFPYAITIHKSQGSTFDHVLLDTEDLDICRRKNFDMYLRLFYVGVSRASESVYCSS